MKIAFITVGDPTRLTGGYLYHARVLAGLRAQGVVVDELVPSGASLDAQLAAASSFGSAFEAHRYDVIVIDALARGVVAPWIAAWRMVRPVVALVHQLPSVAEAEPAQIARERELEGPLLDAERLIAVSAHGSDELVARGVSRQRIAIVSPGFNRLGSTPDAFNPSAERDLWPAEDTTLYALCVAQWIPRKGITTLVQAWRLGDWPGAVLELVGETDADPAYTAQVQALIAQTRPGSVVVRGTVSDATLQAVYQRAGVFVLPSRFEGYGMVYAEALAFGLPVVACNIGPVPDLVTPAAGLFVPPDDAGALASALARLINDAALRNWLATGARHRAAALPSWDDTVRGFRQVLEGVTQGEG